MDWTLGLTFNLSNFDIYKDIQKLLQIVLSSRAHSK